MKLKAKVANGMTDRTVYADRIVHSKLATEGGGIRTVLYGDGTFQVYIGDPVEPSLLIVSGKVNPEERSATGTDDCKQRIGLHETGGRW